MNPEEENKPPVMRYLAMGVIATVFFVVFTLTFVGSPLDHPLEFLAIVLGFLIYAVITTLCDYACCGTDRHPRPLSYDDGGRAPNKISSHYRREPRI